MFKPIFANGEIYHVFNRSIEQNPVFTNKRKLLHVLITIDYYRFYNLKIRLSKALLLERNERQILFNKVKKENKKLIDIISYCFMPSHFHFLVRQNKDDGVKKFVSNFENSYTKYFNTKNKRIGPIFQGVFKGVRIENDNQLLHVSRYIHLNPVSSFLIKEKDLDVYPWSSFPEYLGKAREQICGKDIILKQFPSAEKYRDFVYNHADYAQKLDSIKHLVFDY